MSMDVLEVNTPDELVLWLHLTESEVSMGREEAEIILDYMTEHGRTLAVRNQELFFRNNGEKSTEYWFYSIDDAIHDVCEWNLELLQTVVEGMKKPQNQMEYNRCSKAYGILKQQEQILDRLYRQTRYEQIAQECAFQAIMAVMENAPEELLEKIKSFIEEESRYRKGTTEQEEKWQEEKQQAAEQQERVR